MAETSIYGCLSDFVWAINFLEGDSNSARGGLSARPDGCLTYFKF